ncbi:hypothetical protein [Glycomyces xiaoerkulensis]|uniref:hypothetical protein n=1 Tax=Glycomyces xiaoerkulensis TaxID=2038139 RepID=UPI000C25DC19|nr:hypothetical protein [Glycomyces xiaoerkulensis]
MRSPDHTAAVRAVFDPRARRPEAGTMPPPTPRSLLTHCRDYYRDPLSALTLLLISAAYCYGAGLALFWYHSTALEKGGPPIPWYVHWLLDDTIAFLTLTPVLAVTLPFLTGWSVRIARRRRAGPQRPRRAWPWFALLTGVAFALVTAPGPLVHDALVGRGTPLSDAATRAFGDPALQIDHVHHYGPVAQMLQQLAVGAVLYPVFAVLTVLAVRGVLRTR